MENRLLTWRERGWLWLRLAIRLGLSVLALYVTVRYGKKVLSLFAPFVAALLAAAILNPIIKWTQKRLGLTRQMLTLLFLLLILGMVGGGLFFIMYVGIGEVVSLVQNWDGLLATMQSALEQIEHWFADFWLAVPEGMTTAVQSVTDGALEWLNTATPKLLEGVLEYARQAAMGLPSAFIALLIFVMATFLITADYPYLRTRTLKHVGVNTLKFLNQLRAIVLGAFGGYLKAEFLLSVGVFIILLVGFLITGQSYSFLLAFGLAVLDFVPIIGSGTVMVPWAIIALITSDYKTAVRMIAIWSIVALFRRVMEPKFLGDQSGLSPIASLMGIYVGMKVAGVLGMVFAPIILMVLLNLTHMGMFQSLHRDLAAAAEDLAAILSHATDNKNRS